MSKIFAFVFLLIFENRTFFQNFTPCSMFKEICIIIEYNRIVDKNKIIVARKLYESIFDKVTF